jgi:hypothetical protein
MIYGCEELVTNRYVPAQMKGISQMGGDTKLNPIVIPDSSTTQDEWEEPFKNTQNEWKGDGTGLLNGQHHKVGENVMNNVDRPTTVKLEDDNPKDTGGSQQTLLPERGSFKKKVTSLDPNKSGQRYVIETPPLSPDSSGGGIKLIIKLIMGITQAKKSILYITHKPSKRVVIGIMN